MVSVLQLMSLTDIFSQVTDLRSELEARGLSSKGLKSQLTGRLQKALKGEQEKEEEDEKKKKVKEKIPGKYVDVMSSMLIDCHLNGFKV